MRASNANKRAGRAIRGPPRSLINGLPAFDVFAPVVVIGQVPAKHVIGRGRRLARPPSKMHIGFAGIAAALLAITLLAGGYQVVPAMLAAAVARLNVIDREVRGLAAAVLAGV